MMTNGDPEERILAALWTSITLFERTEGTHFCKESYMIMVKQRIEAASAFIVSAHR